MRDVMRIQKICRRIWANLCGMPIEDSDDSILDDIEENTDDEKDYTQKDYRTMLFNTLILFRKYSKYLREEIEEKDKLLQKEKDKNHKKK